MLEYEKRYKALNAAQKQAVDHIDGPMMVIAGPGTGKTELLSMRTASILDRTDMNPGNILCLTFTESGVRAMRERLIGLIGQDAYRVSIQTFHGFGSDIISSNQDYFYNGADFKPADELSTYEILMNIFEKLSHDSPLASKLGDEFTYMKKVQVTISDFKRAGLTPDEIQRATQHSLDFIDFAEPIIQDFWPAKISKDIISKLPSLIEDLDKYESTPVNVPNIQPLSDIFIEKLQDALIAAEKSGKTNSITAFKDSWLEKNSDGDFVLRSRKRFKQLLAASFIYQDYLLAMQSAKFYDYDDMILRVVHALEVFHDLRLNLQEKYQYIMVDEFQDTNGAQMRILQSLINIPTGDSPNIMVVGDDDQAIYSFQGAEISNLLDFESLLQDPEIITLKQNYRSVSSILDSSRQIISQGVDRLETKLEKIDKTLLPQVKGSGGEVTFTEFDSQAAEYLSLARSIKAALQSGQSATEIAVLARGKRDILALLPYLHHQDIKVSYEHDENILASEPVEILISLCMLISDINKGRVSEADARLSTILSHPSFEIPPETLWQLSLDSYKERQTWLETMLAQEGQLKEIAQWLLSMSTLSPHTPIEPMIDLVFGTQSNEGFASPLKEYFFSKERLKDSPNDYIHWLQSLATIRTMIREYRPGAELHISDFIDYIEVAKKAKITLKNHYSAEVVDGAVQVMTAHKAKGLEFESVYIVGASDETWGSRSRGQSGRLSYPENITIGLAGDSYDDKLRLFFVAMTRAKKQLFISRPETNQTGKTLLKADFLADQKWLESQAKDTKDATLEAAEHTWHPHLDTAKGFNLHELLTPQLKNYRLSATHLNNFIDVTNGGPQGFLLNNLLHFPQSISPSAAMGSAIHKALQKAHQHFRINDNKRPVEDVVGDFEHFLSQMRLPEHDFSYQLQKGSDALRVYLEQSYNKFTPDQEIELDFSKQGSTFKDVALTGIIDVMEVDAKSKSINVVDYKTGKPALSWKGTGDFEKIKLHKYKQQLMFYRLLIENSRDFQGYKVTSSSLEFVEPTSTGKITNLEAEFTEEEFSDFKKLLEAVWKHIISSDFIDTSQYDKSLKGILKFEKDLLL